MTGKTQPPLITSCRLTLLSILWVIILASVSVSVSAQVQTGLPQDLKALIAESLQANPAIKERAQIKTASKEAVRPAGALENPEVSLGIMNLPVNTWSFSQEEMTQAEIGISQKIPFPGKRRLRSEVAVEQNKADDFTLQDKINEIRSQVIQGYWNLSLAQASYDITGKNKQLWEQVVQVAETRYAVGQGLQADVLQAQVELGNYLDRLYQWQQRQESLRAELNALRAKPPGTAITRPQSLKPRSLSLKLENLLALAADQPQIQALQAQIAKQEKAVELARKDFYPDFGVGFAYGFRENSATVARPDSFTASVSMSIPLWRNAKNKPRLREQEALKNAAQDARQSAWDRAAAAIKDRFVTLERLSQQIHLYGKGIVPQAHQATEASLAAYRSGTLDFSGLTQNFITLYSAELKWQEYLKDFENTWAELELLVGQELPRAGATP